MSKSMIVCIAITIVGLAFMLGYKVGDSRGYADGYGEGYSYDCRAEIDSLHQIMKDLNKAVAFQKKTTYETNRRLDSVAYHTMYGVRDSVRAVQFTQDSLKNWDKAKRYNDSISVNGVANTPRKCPNGEISAVEKLYEAMGTKRFSGPVNCQNNKR